MASIFDKIRTITLSNIHGVLDHVIDMNSPEAIKQYIRDLETSIAQLRDTLAGMMGDATGYKRDITTMTTRQAELSSDIDLLLGDGDPSNDATALKMQVEYDGLTGQIAEKQGLLETTNTNIAQLNDGIGKLDAKHTAMVQQLGSITAQAAATKAKNRAVDAVNAANGAMSSLDGAGIDNVQARIQQQADKADASFGMAMGNLASAGEDDVVLAKARAALAARQAKISGAASAQVAADAPASVS